MADPQFMTRTANEIVLSDGEYAYTQDTTKGVINIHTGPLVVNVTGQEHPVIYNAATGRFDKISLETAALVAPLTPQGHYCVLNNPSKDGSFPSEHSKQGSPDLLMGQKVNLHGPMVFALWPRQTALVVKGHHLRSNQYLLVRVYDEKAAKDNWGKAVIKLATSDAEGSVETTAIPEDITVGRLSVIKGTEVSFYMPPTGMEVVKDGAEYVREALTLERLEYCILVDEDGNKRYERGPQVVFPRPTERFYEQDGTSVFRPVELNLIQGIHVKVIAPYKDGDREYKEGEELFITGKDTPIYFPRQEHSLVTYDGRTKHFATAIPAGEARYVMDRITGKIRMAMGPAMLLPDPRNEVIVRRVLSESQCNRWYPGNSDVLTYNRGLRDLAVRAPTTRSGAVSEGEVSRSRMGRKGAVMDSSPGLGQTAVSTGGDEFSHSSSYTQPRTVTLDTKFSGIPTIQAWMGYAVMVVNKSGDRRVVVGPQTILLDYDETLEVLEMSTGKPKTTDSLVKTVYLRVTNNAVSDVVWAETKDHVEVRIKLCLRVNFEGDSPEKWFEAENYVKLLTDHVRSMLKSSIRKVGVEDFYARSEDFVRDALLGVKAEGAPERPGMVFAENSMRVYDVEVMAVEITDVAVAKMISDSQRLAVSSALQLAQSRRALDVTIEEEEIRQKNLEARDATSSLDVEIKGRQIERNLQTTVATLTASLTEAAKNLELAQAKETAEDLKAKASRQRREASAKSDHDIAVKAQTLRLEALTAETTAMVEKFKAAEGGLSEALLTLGNQDTVVKLAQALSVQTMLGGNDFVQVVEKVLGNTPLGDAVKAIGMQAFKAR